MIFVVAETGGSSVADNELAWRLSDRRREGRRMGWLLGVCVRESVNIHTYTYACTESCYVCIYNFCFFSFFFRSWHIYMYTCIDMYTPVSWGSEGGGYVCTGQRDAFYLSRACAR